MAGVLVIGVLSEGGLARATLQVAGAAAPLAQALGEPLIGALIGKDLARAAGEFQCGLAALYLVEGAHYEPYSAEAFMDAAQAVIEASQSTVVLCAQGAPAREWLPRLAARMQAGLVLDCLALAIEGDALIVTKPVNGGGVLAKFAVRGTPRFATVRPSAFQPRAIEGRAESKPLNVAPPDETRVTVLGEESAAGSGGTRLKDAKIVVAGGRGVGGPDNWHYIEEVSAVLGAAVGCSRPVADAGWVASSHQVGLSGTSVAPDLYIAVGISGAAQHLAGITAAKTVVAINNSAEAEIFERADFGVVDDYQDVLRGFVERVKQLRS